MSITATIDWITITFKEYDENAKQFLCSHAHAGKNVSTSPRHGYTAAYRDENGVLVMWNNYRPDMGVHIIFGGSSLRGIYEKGSVEPRDILVSAKELGGRVTRLDLAKDARLEVVNMEKIWNSLEAGAYKGTARKIAQMRGLNAGHTIYIGSRTSERFIRLYDKAAEQAITGGDWKRLEIELKGQAARAVASRIVSGTSLSTCFDMVAQDMIEFIDEREWEKFFPDGDVPFDLPKREKVTDRERWILEQVIPAIRNHVMEVRDSEACWALLRLLMLWSDSQP